MDFIVKEGNSRYEIVIAGGAGAAVQYAAEELQRFIFQSTGVELFIRKEDKVAGSKRLKAISIGDTRLFAASGIAFDYETLNGDGFFIKSVSGDIFINGANDRSRLYGVYELLERFVGVRFIAPDCTYVPKLSDIVFDAPDIVCIPEFYMRIYFNGFLYGGEQYDKYHTRLRFCDSFITGKPAKYGGRSSMWGRRGCHNMHCYVPIEKYGESNPEFYCLYDDPFKDEKGNKEWHVIDLTNGITEDGKLDQSMPVSVIKVAIEEMKIDIVANPDIVYFPFEQHDCGPYIYQPGSAGQALVDKYGRSGILIRFCNVLARSLQEWADSELGGRKIFIETFAYAYTKHAPVKEVNGVIVPIDDTVIAADNLVIRMAYMQDMYRDYFSPEQPPEIKKDMADWRIIAKTFMFWAYDTDFQNYFWYYPTLHTAPANVRGFKDAGIIYLAIEASSNSKDDWQCLLKGYVYSKLMWNQNADWRALIDEFLTIYYGAAAPYVKKMRDMFEKHFEFLFSRFPGLVLWLNNNSMYKEPDLYSETMLNTAVCYIEDGERAILAQDISDTEKEVYLQRLGCVKVTPLHMRLVKYAQQLFDTAKYSGIKRFNSVRPMPEQYEDCDFLFNSRRYVLAPANRPARSPYIPDKAEVYRAAMPDGLVSQINAVDNKAKK